MLFTDVEGSTALQAQRGDAEARMMMGACEELIRTEAAAHRGRVIKSTGDGLMVAFRSPRRAVACALAIDRGLAEDRMRDPGRAVRIRAGLHTGEVIDLGDDLHGAAVSAAARICAAAQPDQVLVSQVVRDLCGVVPDVEFQDHGEASLKGFPEPWRLFRLVSTLDRIAAAGPTPFVGRADVRGTLRELVERAASGRGAFVVLVGEPGIGKTRLAQEVAAEARTRGIAVYTGHCYESRGDPPYMPWVEMLAAAVQRRTPADLAELLGDDAATLAQLMPELRTLLPVIPPMIDIPADQQRRFLLRSVESFLARRASVRPLVLVLEDIHWADPSTLQLLEHVATEVESQPILVLATLRDASSRRSPELNASLARLVRQRMQTVHVHALTVADVTTMLRMLSGHQPPEPVAAAIHAATDGNALFVEEVFRHLAETGRLLDDDGAFRADLRIQDLDVPTNVRLVISQRLEGMSPAARRVLGLAAVVGRVFSFDLLTAVGIVGIEEGLDAVEEAERAMLIGEEADGRQARYRFSHELIRQTLLSELSVARRQRYHLQLADALEAQDQAESIPGDIAQHLLAAGRAASPHRTARHLTLAGDRAESAAAYEEAEGAYALALEHLGDTRTRDYADLLVKLGTARRSLCRWDAAIEVWNEAITLLEALGESAEAAYRCHQACQQLLWGYRFVEMAALAQRGLTAAGNEPTAERARLLSMTALALSLANHWQAAADHMQEAKELAELLGDPAVRGAVWLAEEVQHYFAMRLPECAEAGIRATRELRGTERVWDLGDGLCWLAVAEAFRGRFDSGQVFYEELAEVAERTGHWGAASAGHRARFAVRTARDPDFDALDALARADFSGPEADASNPAWVAYAQTLQGLVAFWRGEWEAAMDHMAAGADGASAFWVGAQTGCILMLNAYRGDAEIVTERLDQLHEIMPERGRPNLLGAWTLALFAAEAVAVLGDAERSRSLYPAVVDALATGTALRQIDGRLLETIAGMAAAGAGLEDEATAHFERALSLADELPHVLEQPQVREAYGRFLKRRDSARGLALLADAERRYAALGMPAHAERAASAQTECEQRVGG